jgi:hypothetical protein
MVCQGCDARIDDNMASQVLQELASPEDILCEGCAEDELYSLMDTLPYMEMDQ